MDKAQQEKIQEIQILEQNLQAISMQRQAFEFELTETDNAIKELERADDEVYKIVGQIMLKAEKKSVRSELEEKKNIFSLRINSLEKQEETITKKLEESKKKLDKN